MESESNKPEQPSTSVTVIDTPREVSALTIGRMMGLATATDLKLIEGKIDLLLTKINTLTTRFEKLTAMAGQFPSTGDIDRIDVAIGALRNALKESGWRGGDSLAPAADEPAKKAGKPNVFVTKPTE